MDTLHHGNIIAVAVPPDSLFFHKETIIDGKAHYSGLVIDILFEIVKGTNISWRFVKADGYSSQNGVLNLIKRGEADMAIGDISLTYKRSLGVNFLFPFMETVYTFMLKQNTGIDGNYLWTFTNPMHSYVWLVAMATVSVLYFLWAATKITIRFSEGSLLWKKVPNDLYTYSHVFLRQSHPLLKSSLGFCGLLLVLSYFLSFMWTNSYMANFVAVTTVKKDNFIDTFEELSLNRRYHVIGYNNTAGLDLVKASNNKIFRDIYKYQIAISDKNFIDLDLPQEEIIHRVENEHVAFLTTSDNINGFLLKSCGMVVSNDDWLKMPVGFPISKKFPYEEFFNRRIIRLRQSGVIQHLYNTYKRTLLNKQIQCETPKRNNVSLKDIFSIYLWFAVGTCTAFIVLLMEICKGGTTQLGCQEISQDNTTELSTENTEPCYTFNYLDRAHDVRSNDIKLDLRHYVSSPSM